MAGAPVETSAVALELDDIQGGAVQERPSPYVGRYLLLRIDDRAAGRRARAPPARGGRRRPHCDPVRDARATVAFTYSGLKQLGVPQESFGQLRAGVPASHGCPRGTAR